MQEIAAEEDTYSVWLRSGVEYARYGDDARHLNILVPSGRDMPQLRPLVVFVQGSAWFEQDTYGGLPQLVDLARSGYVVASVQYRPSTVARAPAQVQDVKAAIRYLRAHAREYGVDPERVGIWGDSSGGHLAALVGTSDGVEAFLTEDNRSESSAVQAVVDFYGPTDFTRMKDHPSAMDHDAANSPESMVIGGPVQDPALRERVQAYNPITYLEERKELPPFLIVHGDLDPLVPFNQSVLLYEALRDGGHQVTFYKVKGGEHGAGIWTPGVLKLVNEFFDRHLK